MEMLMSLGSQIVLIQIKNVELQLLLLVQRNIYSTFRQDYYYLKLLVKGKVI